MRFYKRVDNADKTITVEAYSHNSEVAGAVEIDELEYNDYLAGLPVADPPADRNIYAELDQLRLDLDQLRN